MRDQRVLDREVSAGRPTLFLKLYLGGDVADSEVTDFGLDLETGDTEVIAGVRSEPDCLTTFSEDTLSSTRLHGDQMENWDLRYGYRT